MISNSRRGNPEGVALASAVRNGGPFSSPDIMAFGARGIVGFLNITAVPTVVTVNARIQLRDPVSGNYIDAPDSTIGAAISPKTVNASVAGLYLFQLGNINANFTSSVVSGVMRILMTHSAAGDFTYSVGYSLMA